MGGALLRFPARLVTGQWRTMPSWVAAFERRRLELAEAPPPEAPAPRPGSRRDASHRRAVEHLRASGVEA